MCKRTGFTLIELMVVVAIIALLISITLPAFSEARRVSKKSVCLNNLHQIGVALQTYTQSNRDTYPHVARYPSSEYAIATAASRKPYPTLPIALGKETGGRPPVDIRQYMQELSLTGKKGTNPLFLCPSDVVSPENATTVPPMRGGDKYYDAQTTSYEWENMLDGLRLKFKSLQVLQELVSTPLKNMWVIFDFEPFHGGPQRRGSHNVLYADFHVQSDQYVAGKQVGQKLP